MNEETSRLVEQLAQKLGTTSEYLWGVLLKQAPIAAATELMYLILVTLGGVGLYKLHRFLSKEVDGNNSIYYNAEEAAFVPMFIGTVAWVVMFIACFFSMSTIITGFMNPEYWALKEILDAI